MENKNSFLEVLKYLMPFIPSFGFGIAGQNTSMSIAAGIGVVILIFMNINKIKSFKGLGIEASMRELNDIIHHGEEIIQKIKDLSIKLSGPILIELGLKFLPMRVLSPVSTLEIYEEIIELLNDLEVDQDEIKEASKVILLAIETKLLGYIIRSVKDNKDSYDSDDMEQLTKEILCYDSHEASQREKMFDRLKKLNGHKQDTIDRIEELHYFQKTGYVRKKEIFDD